MRGHRKISVYRGEAPAGEGREAREKYGDITRGEQDLDQVGAGGEGGEGPGAEEEVGAEAGPAELGDPDCYLEERREEGGERCVRRGGGGERETCGLKDKMRDNYTYVDYTSSFTTLALPPSLPPSLPSPPEHSTANGHPWATHHPAPHATTPSTSCYSQSSYS